ELEEALWTFARAEGAEPTDDAAERAIRPAVLRRKKNFGSDSEAGCEWFARLLSVTQTLKRRGLTALDYLTDALRAFRHGSTTPPLPNPS
ncbi:MAG: IS66 family transposase, partial [Gemmataceae bacterium]